MGSILPPSPWSGSEDCRRWSESSPKNSRGSSRLQKRDSWWNYWNGVWVSAGASRFGAGLPLTNWQHVESGWRGRSHLSVDPIFKILPVLRKGIMYIKLLHIILCASFFTAPLASGGNAGIEVWAVSDSVRIDPVRNEPFEVNQNLFPDGIRRGYKQSNLIWDGTARRIMLKAARNETVAFQIVVERTGEKLSNVMVAPTELTGSNGAKISLENVDLFREWYVHVRNPTKESYTLGPGWYADGLLPCLRWNGNLYPHTYVMPFDIPDPLNNVGKEQKSQTLWFDVLRPEIAPGCAAG